MPWDEGGKVKVQVERGSLLQHAFEGFSALPAEKFRNVFEIEFLGEPGLDCGGVAREFYELTSAALFNPDVGLFEAGGAGGGCSMAINPVSDMLVSTEAHSHLEHFAFAGRLLGKALFDGFTVKPHLVRPLYMHLLGWPVRFADLEHIDADSCVTRSLLTASYCFLVLLLTTDLLPILVLFPPHFSTCVFANQVQLAAAARGDGARRDREPRPRLLRDGVRRLAARRGALPGGRRARRGRRQPAGVPRGDDALQAAGHGAPAGTCLLTSDRNLRLLLTRDSLTPSSFPFPLTSFSTCCLFVAARGAQTAALLRGFYDVLPEVLLSVFDFQELELLLCGLPEIDLGDWRLHTEYRGLLERKGAAHKVAGWFWDAVEAMDEEKRARLLQFVTGG